MAIARPISSGEDTVPESLTCPWSQLTDMSHADNVLSAAYLALISVTARDVEGSSNYRTLEELNASLDSDAFWRPHRSFLVNIHRIKEVIPWFKSSFQLRMDDKKQTEVPVSRVQTKRLRALLKL